MARRKQPPTFDAAVKQFYATMQQNAQAAARTTDRVFTVNKVGGCYGPMVSGTRRRLYLGYEVHLESLLDIGILEESFTFPYPTDIKSLHINYASHDHPDATGIMQRPSTLLFSMHDGVGPVLTPIFIPHNDVVHHQDEIVFPRLQRITTLYFTIQAHGLGGRYEVQIVGRG